MDKTISAFLLADYRGQSVALVELHVRLDDVDAGQAKPVQPRNVTASNRVTNC